LIGACMARSAAASIGRVLMFRRSSYTVVTMDANPP
jgi:hypothetical protein